eukprot:scaffold10399_cov113-Cylindrotheca_fusiformis.AAC.1
MKGVSSGCCLPLAHSCCSLLHACASQDSTPFVRLQRQARSREPSRESTASIPAYRSTSPT